MSTQYGTLSHHRTVQVPMWLIVALVVGMLAVGIGYAVDQYQGQTAAATSTVTLPGTHVAAGEGGAVLAANALPAFPGALETSGVMQAAAATSAEASAEASAGASAGTRGGSRPMVNGPFCHQCRL
jgi:hypothetical protein